MKIELNKTRLIGIESIIESFFKQKISSNVPISSATSTTPHNLPADVILRRYFRERKNIPIEDRQFITDTVWDIIRQKSRLSWWVGNILQGKFTQQENVDARHLSLAYFSINDKWNVPTFRQNYNTEFEPNELKLIQRMKGASLNNKDMPQHILLECPSWLEPIMKRQFGEDYVNEMRSMNRVPGMDLRVNSLKGKKREDVIKELSDNNIDAKETKYSPYGIRIPPKQPIDKLDLYNNGVVEVQDEGSQLLSLLTSVKSKEFVIDLCAGAGGKTLGMAVLMENKGRIVSCDVSEKRLSDAWKRIKRAGIDNTRIKLLDADGKKWLKRQQGLVDVVLTDVPCSGVGTWRRAPDARWRITEKEISELVQIQKGILETSAKLLRTGGRLIYGTCSFLKEENENQIEWFLENHPEFSLIPSHHVLHQNPQMKDLFPNGKYLKLTPFKNNTDGFFGAVLQKRKSAPSKNNATTSLTYKNPTLKLDPDRD